MGAGVDVGAAARPGSDWLVGGGDTGRVVRAMDWSRTPLGAIGTWPSNLRTTVNLALNSNFPISLVWGAQYTQIYNDGYAPLCGAKHPWAIGRDFTDTWESAFPVVGEAFYSALSGTTAFLEAQQMFIDRHGYLEEAFFTFSFSPIHDDSGAIVGLFHPVTEMTSQMMAQRRTRTLRNIAAGALSAASMIDGLKSAAAALSDAEADVPFALFYRASADGRTAELIAEHGLLPGGPASPRTVDLTQPSGPWPIAEVLATRTAKTVPALRSTLPNLICPPYPEPVDTAFVLPITPPGYRGLPCVMVAAASPRLPMNDTYHSFYDMVASAVATMIVSTTALDLERQRVDALIEIDREKTAFFNNVSHEFRTPLTLLLGPIEDELADLAEDTAPLHRDRLETAHRNSLRLLRLVNTLLDFARIEDGRVGAHYEPTDLGVLTSQLAATFRSACERAGLDLMVDCPPMTEPVYVDHDMWEGIVLNLLSNALKYTMDGEITLTVRRVGPCVELSVRDTGIGIPETELPRIFERFYRVPGTRGRSHEGSGIGLAFVQQLVGQHGGSVRAESRPGTGTTLTVSIPLGCEHLPAAQVGPAAAEVATNLRSSQSLVAEAMRWAPDFAQPVPTQRTATRATPLPEPLASPDAPPARQRPRVLWADDNADMRDYVARLLAQSYEVDTAVDGQAALESARRSPPDLVLTDVMMPRLDGFGLLRELRADPRTRAIPVILLSARAGEETRIDGLLAGADDYLVKPFTARELFARVGSHVQLAALRREAEAARSAVERADLLDQLNADLERRVQERTDELASSNAELRSANQELEAFSYSVSHDLRSPLRAVDGFARMLLDDYAPDLPDEAQRYITLLRDNARKMGRLIDDLLTFARTGREPLVRREVDSVALVRLCAAELADEFTGRDVRISIGDLPACSADPALLKQVWLNLLSNAIKYSRQRPIAEIVVGSRLSENAVAYFCRDNGAGFDLSHADKIFGVFQRLHRADEYEGTGVGLAIVEQVIRRHGGRIWAQAEVNRGATFYFTLGTHHPAGG